MTNEREKPGFVVDSSGNVRDVRHLRHTCAPEPSSASPENSTYGPSRSASSQKPKETISLIPIPIGLIISLLLSLTYCALRDTNVNTVSPKSVSYESSSGDYHFFRGEYDEAIFAYNIDIYPETDDGNVHNNRGLAYQAKGDHRNAFADFDKALELMPESAMVYNNRALSYYAQGHYDKAIADLDKAIMLEANFGKAYYNRGLTYHAMGDYDQAIEDLTQAVEHSYDRSFIQNTIQEADLSGPGREMIAAFDAQMNTTQIRVDLPSAYYQRSLAYLAKGAYASAISDLDNVIDRRPDSGAAYYARGMAHLAEGNFDEAEADCRTILARGDDPELQELAEIAKSLCDLVMLDDDASSLGNLAFPITTTTDIPVEAPLSPIAVYIPQPYETPVTPKWVHVQVSCDTKPYNSWAAPGTYLYQRADGTFLTVTLEPGEIIPKLGVSVPATLSEAGTVTITTSLGTFQAALLSAASDYSLVTGRLEYIKGTYARSEWYVCGYGLIKLTSSDVGIKTPGNYTYSNNEDLVLVSFTPLTTNGSHVRHILADIQLGNVADAYRAEVTDEETAEALRYWDAGVRVANIDAFERRIIDGQWYIVYKGIENPAVGMDILLTSDSPQ